MVSVFEGQLSRTWFYQPKTRKHVITLYHDTISGVRSASIDFQDMPGSLGNSSLIMESKGHRIFFTVEDYPGYLEIKRSGWTGFSYSCVINDEVIKETTQEVSSNQEIIFKPKILDTTFTDDEHSDQQVAWYIIKTIRANDNYTTTVHRRFRDFAELNSQVKQNFKGHHLRSTLPLLPEKTLKVTTDHRDPAFIQDRLSRLQMFLISLVAVPHVSDMICVKAFLGLMDQVREFSISFHVPTLGLSLLPNDKGNATDSPAMVGIIQKPELCQGVGSGDYISKINGVPVAGTAFGGVVARIKNLPRPIILHFIQVNGPQIQSEPPVEFGFETSNAVTPNRNDTNGNESKIISPRTAANFNSPMDSTLRPTSGPPVAVLTKGNSITATTIPTTTTAANTATGATTNASPLVIPPPRTMDNSRGNGLMPGRGPKPIGKTPSGNLGSNPSDSPMDDPSNASFSSESFSTPNYPPAPPVTPATSFNSTSISPKAYSTMTYQGVRPLTTANSFIESDEQEDSFVNGTTPIVQPPTVEHKTSLPISQKLASLIEPSSSSSPVFAAKAQRSLRDELFGIEPLAPPPIQSSSKPVPFSSKPMPSTTTTTPPMVTINEVNAVPEVTESIEVTNPPAPVVNEPIGWD